jgi:hypothetical protein
LIDLRGQLRIICAFDWGTEFKMQTTCGITLGKKHSSAGDNSLSPHFTPRGVFHLLLAAISSVLCVSTRYAQTNFWSADRTTS